jgi:hypothetical protein
VWNGGALSARSSSGKHLKFLNKFFGVKERLKIGVGM